MVYYQGSIALTETVIGNIGLQIPGWSESYLGNRTWGVLSNNTTSIAFSMYDQRGTQRGVARLFCKKTTTRNVGDLELTLPDGQWHWYGELTIVFRV